MNIKAIIISIGAFITILTGLNYNNYKLPEEVNNEIKDNISVNLESKTNEELQEIQVNDVVLETEEIVEQINKNTIEKKVVEEPKKEEIKTINVQKQEKEQTKDVITKPVQQETKTETIQEQKTNIQEVINENPKPDATPKEPEIPACTSTKHGVGVGNSNKWFDSKEDSINYYKSIIKNWGNKWEKFEIDDETYQKNCPYGYEIWSCPFCEKWTINFYYN